jgi:tRNA G18 (ribose-2'-O)-methylase SpoU
VLEDLTDHTNVGAVFRSAAALGWDAVLLTPRCADPLYRRAVRTSMGAVFQVPWTRLTSGPGTLRDAGFDVVALTPDPAAPPIDGVKGAKVALVLGTEGHGLSGAWLTAATAASIPMRRGVDSLNVGAAAAIALYVLRPGVRH